MRQHLLALPPISKSDALLFSKDNSVIYHGLTLIKIKIVVKSDGSHEVLGNSTCEVDVDVHKNDDSTKGNIPFGGKEGKSRKKNKGKGNSRASVSANVIDKKQSFSQHDGQNSSNTRHKPFTGNMSKLKEIVNGDCLYKRLELKFDATPDEVKKSYKKLLIKYHPDKQNSGRNSDGDEDGLKGENNGEKFLMIQEAFEILSDENYRLQYDSALPLDESVPEVTNFYKKYYYTLKSNGNSKTKLDNNNSNKLNNSTITKKIPKNIMSKMKGMGETCADSVDVSVIPPNLKEEIFFNVFTPLFECNARWSAEKGVPGIGDKDSDDEYVKKFYNFWRDFQSVRDYSVHDSHFLDEAESREEKRWMIKENMKVRKKHVKAEAARIQRLVENAYILDPRVQRMKVAEKEKKEQEKLKKALEEESIRKKKEEEYQEQLKKVEEEENRRKTEEKRILNESLKIKTMKKKWRQRLRFISKNYSDKYRVDDDIQYLCLNCDLEMLEELCLRLCKEAEIPLFWEISRKKKFEAGNENLTEVKLVDDAHITSNCNSNDCNANSSNDQVSSSLFSITDDKRSKIDDILSNAIESVFKERNNPSLNKYSRDDFSISNNNQTMNDCRKNEEKNEICENSIEWSQDELSQLAKVSQKYPVGTENRYELIVALINTDKTIQNVIDKLKQLSNVKSGMDFPERSSNKTTSSKESHLIDKNVKGSFVQNSWNAEQQSALETALKKFPAGLDQRERWNKISEHVDGKSAEQCFQRYKEIRMALRSKIRA